MDSYRLSLGATSVELGSYVLSDPGPDFDPGAILAAKLTHNPNNTRDLLAFEDSRTRVFTFPLRVPSTSQSVDAFEQMLRLVARPGAIIDVAPEGTATANTPRFDVLAGRIDLTNYSIYKQRAGRRDLTVSLQVAPYGYLPTQIILASVASMGLPGALAIPVGSVGGDVPGLAEIVISPSSPTSYPLGTWALDTLGWSLAARASFQGFWPAASLVGELTASLIGESFAPGSQALGVFPSPTLAGWTKAAHLDIPAALAPAYAGRFRLFTWANLSPSQAIGWRIDGDTVPQGGDQVGLASGGIVATIAPAVRGDLMAAASPAYTLLDLGEVTMPPVASAISEPLRVRIWTDVSGTSVGVASPLLKLGGVYLLPLDGAAGYMPRGLAQPSVAPVGSVGALLLSAILPGNYITAATGDLASHYPVADADLYHRGPLPEIGASAASLQLLGGNRRMGAHSALLDELQGLPLIAYYRFSDPAGASAVAPFQTFGPTGIASGASAGRPGGLWGGPSQGAIFFTGSSNSNAVASVVGMPSAFTLFTLFQRSSAVGSQQHIVGGGSSPQGFGIYFEANTPKATLDGAAVATGVGSFVNPDASFHSLAMTCDGGGSPIFQLFYDGSLIGTHQGGSWGAATHNLYFSSLRGQLGSLSFPGMVDETAMIGANLTGTQIQRIHNAALSPTGGATTPIVRASEAFAAVSVSYRPRFAFLRGL